VRILFAVDPKRRAIMLVAGDKQGAWTKWYRKTSGSLTAGLPKLMMDFCL
jgi:hypothetical protein